jgi:anti-anti-sigma factor
MTHIADSAPDSFDQNRSCGEQLHTVVEPGIVRVAGEVDVHSVPQFSLALALSDLDHVVQVLDLSRIDFFSAAGVRCLVEREWPSRPHPSIVASPAVRHVLTLCRLEFLLETHGWRSGFDESVIGFAG